MKKLLVPLTVFVFLLSLLSFSVFSTEYDSPNAITWYFNSFVASPVQGIHACSDDGVRCSSIVYDYIGNKIDVFIHSPADEYVTWCPQFPSDSCTKAPVQTISPTHGTHQNFTYWARDGGNWSNFHLPMGVTYWNNYFYIYEWNNVYKLAINGTMWNYDIDVEVSTPANRYAFIGNPTFNSEYFLYLDARNIRVYKYWIENKSLDITIPSTGLTLCSATGPTAEGLTKIVWYYGETENGDRSLFFQQDCNNLVENYALNMPSGMNYTHYYLDGRVYGSIEGTGLEGIYTVDTDDFSTYTSPSAYYLYNTSVNEDINTSWGLRTTYNRFYQFDRFRNTTANKLYDGFGEMFNYDNLTLVSVNPQYWDDCVTFLNCNEFDAQVNMQVRCDDLNYTSETAFGGFHNFYIPCTDNVTIVTSTSQYTPQISEVTLDLPCSTSNTLDLIHRPIYDLVVVAYDDITYEPLANVDITIGVITETTDAYGRATFNVNPLDNAYFSLYDTTGCQTQYITLGDFTSYFLSAINSEYEEYFETFDLATYQSVKPVYLTPKGINVIVRVFREDGREIDPDDSAVTRIFGANTTYWYTFEKREQNVAFLYPARFLLVDNRTTFEINMTMDFAGVEYTTFQHSGIDYTSFNVTQDETYNFIFVVESADQPCELATDCLTSYCDGNNFFSLSGCINNVCEYAPTVCDFFCDNTVGCYKTKTTQLCDTIYDCDSTCTGNFTATIGFCGEDGVCVTDERVCNQPCEESEVNVTGGTKIIGLCPDIFACYQLGSGVGQSFTLKVQHPDATVTKYLETTYRCSLQTAGTRECIDGATVQTNRIENVVTIPVAWTSNVVGTNTVFHDVSASCSQGCNITWEFCSFGCDDVTGTCWAEPSSAAGGIYNAFAMIIGLWSTIFPTIVETTIAWLILSILIGAVVEFVVGGRIGRGMGVIFGFVMMGMLLGGSFALQVPWELSIVFTILAGFVVWRLWSPSGGGG